MKQHVFKKHPVRQVGHHAWAVDEAPDGATIDLGRSSGEADRLVIQHIESGKCTLEKSKNQ